VDFDCSGGGVTGLQACNWRLNVQLEFAFRSVLLHTLRDPHSPPPPRQWNPMARTRPW
jgi:hypothetical protein